METYRTFTTKNGELILQYPAYWLDEMEDPNTYLFYEEYLGSFRINIKTISTKGFNIKEYLEKEFKNKAVYDPQWKSYNDLEYLCYEDDWENNNHITHIHYFISGNKNTVITCSFAYDSSVIDDPVGTDEIGKELKGVEKVLTSIIFMGD
jgi:hypothetical protein